MTMPGQCSIKKVLSQALVALSVVLSSKIQLTAGQANETTAHYCDICNPGFVVTDYEAVLPPGVDYYVPNVMTCRDAEHLGNLGAIPLAECVLLRFQASEICGCTDESLLPPTVPTAPVSPLESAGPPAVTMPTNSSFTAPSAAPVAIPSPTIPTVATMTVAPSDDPDVRPADSGDDDGDRIGSLNRNVFYAIMAGIVAVVLMCLCFVAVRLRRQRHTAPVGPENSADVSPFPEEIFNDRPKEKSMAFPPNTPRSLGLPTNAPLASRIAVETARMGFSNVSSKDGSSTTSLSSLRTDMLSRTIIAPPGKLGLTIDTTLEGAKVHSVSKKSPLYKQIFPGDLILSLNNTDTRAMTGMALSALVANSGVAPRELVVLSQDMVQRPPNLAVSSARQQLIAETQRDVEAQAHADLQSDSLSIAEDKSPAEAQTNVGLPSSVVAHTIVDTQSPVDTETNEEVQTDVEAQPKVESQGADEAQANEGVQGDAEAQTAVEPGSVVEAQKNDDVQGDSEAHSGPPSLAEESPKRKLIMLFSSMPMNRQVASNQNRATTALNANGILYDMLDGVTHAELRDELMEVSPMKRGTYPQFFWVDLDTGLPTFVGDWEVFSLANENGTLVEEFGGV